MDVALLATLVALVKKATDWSKYLTNGDTNGALTQVAVWIIGVAAVWTASQSDLFGTITVVGVQLQKVNMASIVLLGMSLASTGSLVTDHLLSRDSTVKTNVLKLFPGVKGGSPAAKEGTHKKAA